MSRFVFVIAVMLSVSPVSARAEEKMVVDMGKLTCSQLTKLGFQDFAGVTMWLSGYYNSSIRNTVVDLAQFARRCHKSEELLPDERARHGAVGGGSPALGIRMPR